MFGLGSHGKVSANYAKVSIRKSNTYFYNLQYIANVLTIFLATKVSNKKCNGHFDASTLPFFEQQGLRTLGGDGAS